MDRTALAIIIVLVVIGAALTILLNKNVTASPEGVGTGETGILRAGTLQGGISTLDIIEQEKLYERYGFKLEVLRFQKTPEILAALSKGEADVAVIPAEMAAKMMQNGEDLVIIAVDMMQNQAILSLDESINDICGLRGKLVGAVVASGTYKVFKAYVSTICNISVVETSETSNDYIAVVNVPPGSLLDALANRDVDAVVIWEPLVSRIIISLGAKIVDEYRELWSRAGVHGEAVMLVWVAKKEFVENHQDIIEKFLRARREAATIWIKDRDKVVNILETLYGLSPSEVEYLYNRVVINDRPLDKSLINSIYEEWRLAWLGGYLEKDPAGIGEEHFYQS